MGAATWSDRLSPAQVDAMSAPVRALIEANAPFWGAEAEVVRSYFDAPDRGDRGDLAWLARQCHKELFDGVLPRLDAAREQILLLDDGHSADVLATTLHEAWEELDHYRAFAAIYDAVRGPGDAVLTYVTLRDEWAWPENAELCALRRLHRQEHGVLGVRACAFTEGGGATLYLEGARLEGRRAADATIVKVCERVLDDEVGHMFAGVADLGATELTTEEWATLSDLTVAQLRLRIPMRNAQFGWPVSPERIAQLQTDGARPVSYVDR